MKCAKIFFLFVVLLSFVKSFSQTYSSVIADKEIYDFMDWVISKDSFYNGNVYYKITSWHPGNFVKDTIHFKKYPLDLDLEYLFYEGSPADTLFNDEDKKFLSKQFHSIKDSLWQDKFTAGRLVRDEKKIWGKHIYSIPLFSSDKNHVIIYEGFDGGRRSGWGGYSLYKRVNAKEWKFITAILSWIS